MLAQTSSQYETETAFLRLLPSIVGAEPESYTQEDETKLAAIAILKRHPELLFEQRMETDHFGRKIKASPYRLLLGAGDVWAFLLWLASLIGTIKMVRRAVARVTATCGFGQLMENKNRSLWKLLCGNA